MKSSFFHTIAFRLTVWFAGIFTICSGVAFVLFYFFATQTIQEQVDQDLLDNAAKFSATIHQRGLIGASQLAVLEAQAAGEKSIFIRLVYPTGEVFASSHMSHWTNVKVNKNAIRTLAFNQNKIFETIVLPATDQKARILYAYVAKNAILQIGISLDYSEKFLAAFKKVFISAMGFIIIFSAFMGWLLIRKALSGVAKITQTAQNISGSNLEDRVKGSGRKDELELLVTTFNSMLDRIEQLVISIQEISDNIAHDLKSPITRIRGFAELSLIHDETIGNYQAMAANTIEESDRLLDMINTMLLISRVQAGKGDFDSELIDLSDMVEEACDLFMPLAEDKNIKIKKTIESGLYIQGDRKMLQRALTNLLDNAIKYTPEQGNISVVTELDREKVKIRIKDSGVGIAPEYFEKIFDRFYRTESSRSTSGSGLGLSLAKTIAEQHKGRISVSSQKDTGSCFTLTLPYSNLKIIESSS